MSVSSTGIGALVRVEEFYSSERSHRQVRFHLYIFREKRSAYVCDSIQWNR